MEILRERRAAREPRSRPATVSVPSRGCTTADKRYSVINTGQPAAGPGSRLRATTWSNHWEKDRCSKKVIFDAAHSFVLGQSALLLRNSESSVPHGRSLIR